MQKKKGQRGETPNGWNRSRCGEARRAKCCVCSDKTWQMLLMCPGSVGSWGEERMLGEHMCPLEQTVERQVKPLIVNQLWSNVLFYSQIYALPVQTLCILLQQDKNWARLNKCIVKSLRVCSWFSGNKGHNTRIHPIFPQINKSAEAIHQKVWLHT